MATLMQLTPPAKEPAIVSPPGCSSSVWKWFGFYETANKTLDKTSAFCKLCKTKIKYLRNTTNMQQHLKRFHPETENAPPPVAPAQQRTILDTVTKLPRTSEKARRITRAIGVFIGTDMQPYSVANNKAFRDMIRAAEPRYKCPHRSYFAKTEVPKIYNEAKEKVLDSLKAAPRVAITCDAWMSVATESFVTITAHLLDEEWRLVSHVLQTRSMSVSHTGENVAKVLGDAAEEWKITEKATVLVTDNASNMVLAARKANFVHLKCYAHTANLAAQKALKVAAVAKLLARIRRISTFFHHSTIATHLLKENQKLLGLKEQKLLTDVCTRWNSAYDMVDRFLQQQPAISAALLNPQLRRQEKDIATLSETDVTNAEEMCLALKQMKDVTILMSQEKNPTVSLIAPLHAQLLQDAESNPADTAVVREIKRAIYEDLSNRYNSETEKKLLHSASAIDPRFKALPFLTEEEREQIYTNIIAEAASLEESEVRVEEEEKEEDQGKGQEEGSQNSPPAKKSASVNLLENLLGATFSRTQAPEQQKSAYTRASEEMVKYRAAEIPSLQENPLLWWKKHQVVYPMISHVARRYLCIPGTSVSAERVFSTAGDVVTAKRSLLSSEHVDQLLFIQKNVHVSGSESDDDDDK